jgi:hypothetical protein
MEMFGGLTRTSSRIAIAAALGLGAFGLSASPASAYGGNCCADLEERVAELEASAVQKGNRKVSITISGWVIQSMNWWDDGALSDSWIGTKDADLGSRFALTGSATIAPGWSGGYNITVTTPGGWSGTLLDGNNFGIFSNQYRQDSLSLASIQTLYSYMYIKSDDWGTINLGYLSPASDNAAVLADISGTVIESNAVGFEGFGFNVRPDGAPGGFNGIVPGGLTWGAFAGCSLVGPIGADCYGAPQSGVRYDSPTFYGFRVEASYSDDYGGLNAFRALPLADAPEVWDVALFYAEDWGDFKISAAYSYTQSNGNYFSANPLGDVRIHQIGATAMHVPTGLGVYGYYNNEDIGGNYRNFRGNLQGVPSWDSWYVKPFIKRTWNPLGATVFFGEYAQYNDGYNGVAGADTCPSFVPGSTAGNYCGRAAGNQLFVTGSQIDRWGLGAVQEIDAAAMHVFARWQHQQADVDFVGFNNVTNTRANVDQGFEEFDFFQVGGIIFF